MSREVILVKSFTQDPEQGNPAGVVLDAEGMSDESMVHVAGQLGFSETAFVFASEKVDRRVRFFSPEKEVPMCGHATVAVAHVLHDIGVVGKRYVQDTMAGRVEVDIASDGRVIMTQNEAAFFDEKQDRDVVAGLLGIRAPDLLDFPVQAVSTAGVPKLMIPLARMDVLRQLRPDLDGIRAYCEDSEVRGFYPFTQEVLEEGSDLHARQFNPLAGIDEDPITGVAAGGLGAYVLKYGLVKKKELVVEQGYVMGMGGKMYVDLRDGVRVGGYAVEYDRVGI